MAAVMNGNGVVATYEADAAKAKLAVKAVAPSGATSFSVKAGLAQMLKGGVIMDVVNVEQARIAEEAGACAGGSCRICGVSCSLVFPSRLLVVDLSQPGMRMARPTLPDVEVFLIMLWYPSLCLRFRAVMALERVPADIRKNGGVARMSDPQMIKEIKAAVTIPVMAKVSKTEHEGPNHYVNIGKVVLTSRCFLLRKHTH